jgi:ABC-type transport system involved in cytochrome c biogenesis ATPase subunit
VLDEPWEGLDAGSRELVPTLVTDVTGAGGAVMVRAAGHDKCAGTRGERTVISSRTRMRR